MFRLQNDKEVLEMLYELYEQKMYYIAYAILNDEWQAEDAVQDAFIKILNHIQKIRNPRSDRTKKYIIRVIQSTAIDLYRRNQKMAGQSELQEWTCSTEGIRSEYEEKQALAEILNKLPMTYRRVVELRGVYGYSSKETAAIMELKESTVRKRYERGLKILREMEESRHEESEKNA